VNPSEVQTDHVVVSTFSLVGCMGRRFDRFQLGAPIEGSDLGSRPLAEVDCSQEGKHSTNDRVEINEITAKY